MREKREQNHFGAEKTEQKRATPFHPNKLKAGLCCPTASESAPRSHGSIPSDSENGKRRPEAYCAFHGAWFCAQWGELVLGSLDQRGITEGEFASMTLGDKLLGPKGKMASAEPAGKSISAVGRGNLLNDRSFSKCLTPF